jgi:predicted Rossmann fold flavoprotein
LQISSYWREGETLSIDWLPDCSEDWLAERKRARPKAQLKSALAEVLPERFAELLAKAYAQNALGDMKDAALADIMRTFKSWPLTPAGTEGYAKAEVMVGGVDTNALLQQTMACRAVPGLFFIGECVDVTGWLGGYNFQWAWSSGWAAGQSL